ncbi:MAG: hypothetical protein M0C28_40335 [Candidatus Moduliflexus flocculans]|nr:hypothetical protein [Candidatus Moduliflexus flocculans]
MVNVQRQPRDELRRCLVQQGPDRRPGLDGRGPRSPSRASASPNKDVPDLARPLHPLLHPDLRAGRLSRPSTPTTARSWARPSPSGSPASSTQRVVELLPAFTFGRDPGGDRGEPGRPRPERGPGHQRPQPDRQARPHLGPDPRRDDQPRLQPGRGRRRPGRRQPPLLPLLRGEAALLPRGQRPVAVRPGTMEDAPLYSLVYTRTIVDPTFGFKLTGKVTPRDTVAAIYAQDDLGSGDEVDDVTPTS